MSTQGDVLNDDLTTDAIPSAPRDEEEINEEAKDHINFHFRNATSNKRQKSKFEKFKHETPEFPMMSIVNISHATGVQFGNNFNIYMNKTDGTGNKKDFVVTDAIRTLFTSTLPVTKENISFISAHVNEQWRETARTLHYSPGQISQFYENHSRSGLKEVIYQFLLDWIQNEVDAATVGKLSNALWKTNQQDAVIRWSKNFHKTK